jgi:AraC-like DNA-binding protein/tetratricopeptide (TPR) repeat protein
MSDRPLPRDVRKAIDLLRGDLGRPWRVDDLARGCEVPRRTLEKHFRRFMGCAPLEFLRSERLGRARRRLLRGSPDANVTVFATDCGLTHLGRFAMDYRDRYGESPSATLRLRRIPIRPRTASIHLPESLVRPRLSILPFDLVGSEAARVGGIADEIASALHRTGWIRVVPISEGRYHLHGRVKDQGMGTLRIRLTLLDRSTLRYIWVDLLEFAIGDVFGSPDWLSDVVSGAVRSVIRGSEIDRVSDKDPLELNAWELSMRALPLVLAANPADQRTAIELLDRAIECGPRDPVPLSLAAWCHGLRAGHHFTTDKNHERNKALRLASDATGSGAGDPMAHTMLSAAYMLTHELPAAEYHARAALTIDGASAWGWGRLGWVHAYRGETGKAIECCHIARVLAPSDALKFVWSIGIAAANFELGHYNQAIQWYDRALIEQPKATWINRFLAPAFAMAGGKDRGRHSLDALYRSFPELTIAEIRTGLPHTVHLLDRIGEGLAALGMRYF